MNVLKPGIAIARIVATLALLAGICGAQRPTPEMVTGGDMMREARNPGARFPGTQSPAMPVPLLEKKGTIRRLDSMGVTLADKKGKTQLYLCCEKRTQFGAKKGTPLASSTSLSLGDFKIGDVVQVRFEGLHYIVRRLRLLARPSGK